MDYFNNNNKKEWVDCKLTSTDRITDLEVIKKRKVAVHLPLIIKNFIVTLVKIEFFIFIYSKEQFGNILNFLEAGIFTF